MTALRLHVLGLLAMGLSCAAAADGPSVEASTVSGSAIAIDARARLRVPEQLIWRTLTDYEHLPEFIPGMKVSRVVDRKGGAAIVQQQGEARLLFLSFPIKVLVESTEFPPHVITIRVLKGNLKQLDGLYRIEPGASPEERVLRWVGIIEPDSLLPAFITVMVMRANVESQFTGMVREIERRDAARRRAEGSHVGQ
jgi:ribosome-associated toxin RatA of RatAB toxin-antitoxin module